MAYGNEAGIVIIDIEQKVCLLNVGSPDLYGAQDPYSRVPRSPKRGGGLTSDTLPINMERDERQPRSPSIDQVSSFFANKKFFLGPLCSLRFFCFQITHNNNKKNTYYTFIYRV